MTDADCEARQDLELACRDQDAEEVSKLFATRSLNPDDATAAMKEARIDPAIMRILFQNGADPSAIHIEQVAFCDDDAPEILRLLDEYGYNFARDGHIILQSVAFTSDSEQPTNPSQRFCTRSGDSRLASRPWREYQSNRPYTPARRFQSLPRRER